MSGERSVTDDEIASYVARKAEELRRVCEVKGWWSLAITLAVVVTEASGLAESESKERAERKPIVQSD